MALQFKKGDAVRQVAPVITGTIAEPVIIDGEVQYRVDYTDADGQPAQRTFRESELAAAE